MLGMARSVITRSCVQSFIISSAVSPSFATRMSYPWLDSEVRKTRVICDSSSTTRMCLCSVIFDQQPDAKTGFVSVYCLAFSARFLRDNVHIYRRSIPQKLMNCRQIKISLPTLRCRATEDHLRNM